MKYFIKLMSCYIILFSLESCFTQQQIIKLAQNIVGIQGICVSQPINTKFNPNRPTEIKIVVTLANTNDVDVTGRVSLQAYAFRKNDELIGISDYYPTPIVLFPKNKTNAYISDTLTITVSTEASFKIGETYKFQIRLFNPVNPPSIDNPFSSCTLYNEFKKIN